MASCWGARDTDGRRLAFLMCSLACGVGVHCFLQTAQRDGVNFAVCLLHFLETQGKIRRGFSSFSSSFSRCSWFPLFLALRMEIMSHVHGLVLL